MPVSEPENKWSYADTSFKAAFSETNIRYGYQISFRPPGAAGLTYGLTLQFTQKPQSAGGYTVSKNPSSAGEVKIMVENGIAPIYSSTGIANSQVQTLIKEGKLTFSGANIMVVRDTIPSLADTLMVSFNLTEF